MESLKVIDYHGYVMTKQYSENVLMMATLAEHKLGNASSMRPDLCAICGEYFDQSTGKDYYVGCWHRGSLINLRFPKETTRPLTEEEKKKFLRN